MTTPLHGLLGREPVVATAGVGLLADALRDQAVAVTETDWRPPPDGTSAPVPRKPSAVSKSPHWPTFH